MTPPLVHYSIENLTGLQAPCEACGRIVLSHEARWKILLTKGDRPSQGSEGGRGPGPWIHASRVCAEEIIRLMVVRSEETIWWAMPGDVFYLPNQTSNPWTHEGFREAIVASLSD